MCFSIGELDMKVSRLLFASLLCGVIGVDVMAFNQGNAEMNDDSQESDEEDIEQGGAHGGGVPLPAFSPHAFGGRTENVPHVVQERRFGAFTGVQVDITEHVYYILEIANAVRNAIARHISKHNSAELDECFRAVYSALKELRSVVIDFSCERGPNNKLKTIDFIYRMRLMLVALYVAAPLQHTISINGVNGVDCKQIMDSYLSIFCGLHHIALLANNRTPSAVDLKIAFKYMNDFLHILSELKANPQNAYSMFYDICDMCSKIQELRVDDGNRVAVQTNDKDQHGRLPAQNVSTDIGDIMSTILNYAASLISSHQCKIDRAEAAKLSEVILLSLKELRRGLNVGLDEISNDAIRLIGCIKELFFLLVGTMPHIPVEINGVVGTGTAYINDFLHCYGWILDNISHLIAIKQYKNDRKTLSLIREHLNSLLHVLTHPEQYDLDTCTRLNFKTYEFCCDNMRRGGMRSSSNRPHNS
jgi:hypothetical protein